MQFVDLMKLEEHGPDTFVGVGPLYPWGGLYGGQIVAQGLKAASRSVRPEHEVHSLHAYFIRRGQHDAPVRYEVDRIRDGRSFTTRRVVARQSGGAILNMSCSFSVREGDLDIQNRPMPAVLGPEEIGDAGDSWIDVFQRRDVKSSEPGQRAGWFRTSTPIGEEAIDHACALAYFSDDFPCEAGALRHPDWTEGHEKLWMTSLDHAIWFHRPARADGWMLHDFRGQSLVGTRALATGHVYSPDGTHVATVNQESLVRTKL